MGHFYFFDLAKNLFRKKNIFALAYLIMNICIVIAVFRYISDDKTYATFCALYLYLVAMIVVLSPAGEWVLRLTQGCEKIKDEKILARLEPLFLEAVERARTKHTAYPIDEAVTLYIQESADLNAFAVGRNTVCVTTGLLACSDDEIRAVLGHELGHLATHDTDLLLLITVGNFFISAIVTIVKGLIIFCKLFLSFVAALLGRNEGGIVVGIITAVTSFLSLIFVDAVMKHLHLSQAYRIHGHELLCNPLLYTSL